ncbi:MAG: carbon starvation protein A [Planctomycetaceae bacterium]|nr:carbon starvation protein A [Planctomycetaceae bacterium]
MSTLIVVLVTVVALVSAYRIYGSYLAEKIFQLNDGRLVPSREMEDQIDFVPTRKSVVFGHHFTSIAGTGPIVGPALAVFWGWLPALLWVLLGGIFVGAVHDFGSLVVSLRNRGETIGQVAGRLISKRTRLLFLLILFFALTVVLGIFGLVVAQVFQLYPSSVLGTWISLPLAVLFGWLARKGKSASSSMLLVMMLVIYGSVWLGAYHMPIQLEPDKWWAAMGGETVPSWANSVVLWTIILLVYCYFASVMPVSLLLQPRDYLNSWQLIIALCVLVAAICYAGATNQADLVASAPAMVAANEMPAGAPPMFPFLFITIACGAVSGFHCLVSSGTTSKQVAQESDSQAIGFGSMLLESGLAVTVILACCAGIGMGLFQRTETTDAAGKTRYQFVAKEAIDPTKMPSPIAEPVAEEAAKFAIWRERYDPARSWNDYRMAETVGAFVDGGASFLTVFKIPLVLGQAVLAVLVACFAATTLDSATRLQRYVIQELGTNLKLKPVENKYVATGIAVGLAAMIALMPSSSGGPGTGGTILWPLFGATNQLLAGLAFLVILFYLWRRGIPVHFLVLPLVLMAVMPLWALGYQLFGPNGFLVAGKAQNWVLGSIGVATIFLQLWMFAEALWLLPKVRGLRETAIDSKSSTK